MHRVKNGSATSRVDARTIDGVCEEVARLVEPGERDLAVRFTQLFLAKAPPEYFQGRSPDVHARLALGAFRFLQRSRFDRVDVEVFNPDAAVEGWSAPVTVIRTNVSERPFIVDTIREYLHAEDLAIERFVYPVLHVARDEDGRVVDVGPAAAGDPRESLIHCEIPQVAEPERLEALREAIRGNLEDVVAATDDFGAMVDALDRSVDALSDYARKLPGREAEIREIQEFLRWLRDGSFVFIGYRGYDILDDADGGRSLVVERGSGLGVLRDESASSFARPVPLASLSPGLRERVEGGPLLIISKTNAQATVHRRARMDYIGVRKLDDRGRIVGERRFIGLFTSQAFSEDAEQIPILREKLRAILLDAGLMPGSHDWKETITIFNSMPKEELFLTSAEQIGDEIRAVLAAYHTNEVKVTMRPDPLDLGVSVMVILPKERFSGEVRKAIEAAFVERFEGSVLNYHLALGGGDQARLHFHITTTHEKLDEVGVEELERIVRGIIRSWTDRVREGLEAVRPGEEARRLARRYGAAFSAEYRAATQPEVAERDILELEAMAAEGRRIAIHLTNPEPAEGVAGGEPITQLKLFLRGERLVLSDFMPILENVGLRVIAMTPYEVHGEGVEDATIDVFAVQDAAGRPIDLAERGALLSETILAVRAGEAANDSLNALVLSAGLAWREVDVLRAYAEYAFQSGAVPSRLSLPTALRAYPQAAKLLFRLFETKFDPANGLSPEDRARQAAAIQEEFIRSLRDVSSLADDRALRRLLALIEATVRTNYYRHGGAKPTFRSGGAPYISLKFSCELLQGITRSRLLYEVWVQSARMAGIHFRGAKVARGGIRWSDRPDDFRTEILGLVKTQNVKNAVIVPAGSKGGFVIRRRPTDPKALADEGVEQYRTFIRGLLDITDNLVDGEIVSPPGVIAYDEPDPYLVVAADKGTAKFSDIANAISAEYGFWLDDAFASGGSNGYDHKAVGITARGGWECVKRHFREMGRDIQNEPFTVVGIGDMSGDVFGNGMLLSRQIRLIAAFDHRHIFIDPDPDPEASYAERKRLFEAGRTSWDDYDRSVLSEGGMIVPRGAKEVEITPQARAALGLPDDVQVMDGESLIRAVLAAPVDLLWNGGIGTYVKASTETHAEVGDSTNDAVRIDAKELRAKVVGEGGNLGFTQRARIEAALAGVRINTDAIDNSGGVDMSDREVNLKILLNRAVATGVMTREERNRLLEELTPAVTRLVLGDNRSQSLAISLDEIRVQSGTEDFQQFMLRLERDGLVDRASEHLPSSDVLAERRARGETLTRPELAVLLAYAKLSLKRAILDSSLPDDPAAEEYLWGYFPAEAVEAVGQGMLAAHRLRREIIASQLTNDLVDLMGASFVFRTSRDTGHSPVEVARAWLIASRLAGARALRENLAEVEGEVAAAVVYRWLLGLARVLERTTRWALANVPADVPTTAVIEEYLPGLATLRRHFDEVVAGEERRIYEERIGELQVLTERPDLAKRLITLRFLDQLMEILRVARVTGADPVQVGRAYYLASDRLEVGWLRQALAEAVGEDRWDQRAAQALADDLGRAVRDIAARLVARGDGVTADAFDGRGELASFRELLDEIRADGRVGLSALTVAIRELQAFAETL
jgi:glutamate dehydrogenase